MVVKRNLLRAAIATFALGTLSCVSSSGTAVALDGCEHDPRLLGSWRSYRVSQLGPAWMSLSFDCRCVYRMSGQLMWMRIREEGNYRLAEGALVFTRASGTETPLPYRFEGESLVVEEHPGEFHRYKRTSRRECR